jgi:hypothetical protein
VSQLDLLSKYVQAWTHIQLAHCYCPAIALLLLCLFPFTAPHRTAPHRTAPHRTAPHRTAPHGTAPHHNNHNNNNNNNNQEKGKRRGKEKRKLSEGFLQKEKKLKYSITIVLH